MLTKKTRQSLQTGTQRLNTGGRGRQLNTGGTHWGVIKHTLGARIERKWAHRDFKTREEILTDRKDGHPTLGTLIKLFFFNISSTAQAPKGWSRRW